MPWHWHQLSWFVFRIPSHYFFIPAGDGLSPGGVVPLATQQLPSQGTNYFLSNVPKKQKSKRIPAAPVAKEAPQNDTSEGSVLFQRLHRGGGRPEIGLFSQICISPNS